MAQRDDDRSSAERRRRLTNQREATFNPYSAGRKHYGTGRPMPTSGKVTDKKGYSQRDAKAKARREALIRRASGRVF